MMRVNPQRAKPLNSCAEKPGPVIYWMSRDQRLSDNWALLYAQEKAIEYKTELIVLFCLVKEFLQANTAHFSFMIEGLKETAIGLQEKRIGFQCLLEDPVQEIPRFIIDRGAGLLVTDFDPLRLKRSWKESIAEETAIPMIEVDTHNIIPCWIASPKREYAAYTFRPKVHKILDQFLEPFPKLIAHPFPGDTADEKTPDWQKIEDFPVGMTHSPSYSFQPGEKAARKAMKEFLDDRIHRYGEDQNNPALNGQSNLSPYLHFGHLSAQRLALKGERRNTDPESTGAFLEQLIVRRELSDNYCFYEPNYDSPKAFPDWAKITLDAHRFDDREYLYSRKEFEQAATHDRLWNAAQMQMVNTGKMHGYMRMYWAKKILEWSESPEEAMETAICLNDSYQLDGRDPNGYTGIAWSIGGVHDRAWSERPIFGKIRYMSYKGCRSKFDVDAYIEKVESD